MYSLKEREVIEKRMQIQIMYKFGGIRIFNLLNDIFQFDVIFLFIFFLDFVIPHEDAKIHFIQLLKI